MAITPERNTNYPYLNQPGGSLNHKFLGIDPVPWWVRTETISASRDRGRENDVPWWAREMDIVECYQKADIEIKKLEKEFQENLNDGAYYLQELLGRAYETWIECKSIRAIRDYPTWTIEKCWEEYDKNIEDSWKLYEERQQRIREAYYRNLLLVEGILKKCIENSTQDIPVDTR